MWTSVEPGWTVPYCEEGGFVMNDNDQKIIDEIMRKVEIISPGSMELPGVYGSAATGDVHEKSDLNLLFIVDETVRRQVSD